MSFQLADLFGYFSVLLRAGTLVFQSLLLGGVMFALWVARGSRALPGDSLETVRRTSLRLLRSSALGLAVTQLLYLYVDSTVLMATSGIGFRDVIGANFFLASSSILLAALLSFAVAGMAPKVRAVGQPLLAAAVFAASLITNHAASRLDHRIPLLTLTALHEAPVGFWIGGLPFLILGLFRAKDAPTRWYLAERFSHMALISVGVLVLSGFALSVAFIGSWQAVLGTAYGVMVTAKAVMLFALLALGGVNFFLLRNSDAEVVMPRLRRLVEAELGIGLTIILTAASLTSQPPAVDQANQIVSRQEIILRFTPTWPRFGYPQSVYHDLTRTPATAPATTEATLMPKDVDGVPLAAWRIAEIEESESNHHWMGLIVLAMGILALLSQSGMAPWARYWPLLLVFIAIWIFIRADTDAWPYGPIGFWAAWLHTEIFQHRLAAIVCILFAVFELRVRMHNLQGSALSLVFPFMCALGGAVLLTHSHGITNVKENLLVELSHVPMGVIAVFAGWSRWLEIRLPPENRRVPSWIWPVCFVLIGAGLLNYREM